MGTEQKVIVDPEVLDAFLKTLDDMRAKNALSDDAYYQCVLSMAYEFMEKHSNNERALVLINMCPPEYFKGAFQQQLRVDKLFAASMFKMVYLLIQAGFTGIELEEPNQAPAEA